MTNFKCMKLDEYLDLRKNSEGIAFVELDAGSKFESEIFMPVYISAKAISEIKQIDSAIVEVSDKNGVGFAVDAKCIRMPDFNKESIETWNYLMDIYEENHPNFISSINSLFKIYNSPLKETVDYKRLANQIYISFNSESRRNMRIIRKEYIDTEFQAEKYTSVLQTVASLGFPVLIPVKYYTKFFDQTKNENPIVNIENEGYLIAKIFEHPEEGKKVVNVYDIHQNIMHIRIDDLLVLKPTTKNTTININTLYDVWFRNSANNFKLTHIFYESYKQS